MTKRAPINERIGFTMYSLQTREMEHVMDDDYWRVAVGVEPHLAFRDESPYIALKATGDAPNTIAWGGVMVLSNLKVPVLQHAMMIGINAMLKQGMIDEDQLYDGLGD